MSVFEQSSIAGDPSFWMATVIFSVSLIAIMTDKIHKTVVAVFGASLVLVLKILDQHEAFHLEEYGVDWNVVFLLVGMMIIINLVRPTGMFEYIAIKSAKLGNGEPVRILVILSLVTAVLSALLDNVTTILLIAPVTLLIAEALQVDAIPFLIAEALSSNIGGTATLIGDPPNIMIASRAHLSFVDFLVHMLPAVVVIMAVFLVIIRMFFANRLIADRALKHRVMNMRESEAIRDKRMLVKSIAVLALVMIGFALHGVLGYEPATVALFGAGLLLLLAGSSELHRSLVEVEWPVIFFFIGLFIMVGGLVKVGLINMLSLELIDLTQGNMMVASMLIMWFSAIASAIIDNIPFVASMNPLIVDMAKEMWPHLSGTALLHHHELMPVWWSLALGACLGGNGSPIGASANVIVVGMAEKAGYKISFLRFMAYGVPVTLLTVCMAMVYVLLRYYLFA